MHLHAAFSIRLLAVAMPFQLSPDRARGDVEGEGVGPLGHMSTAIVIILTKVSIEAHIANKYKRFYGFIQSVACGAYRK